MEWKSIKLEGIKPIYEISPEGDIRRLDTGRIFSGGERIMVTMADGTYKHFFRSALTRATYRTDNMALPFSDEVTTLMDQIETSLKKVYKSIIFAVTKLDVVDMFAIQCDRFKYPLSIKREYQNKYAIRTGKQWEDPLYYGSNHSSTSYTYYECSYDEVVNMVLRIVHKKVYSNPVHRPSRPLMYKPSITKEECEEFCKELIRHKFKLTETVDVCKRSGIKISREYARKIVKKERFCEVSDLYFEYHGDVHDAIDPNKFVLVKLGKSMMRMIYEITLYKGDFVDKRMYATTYPQAVMCKRMLDDVYCGTHKNRDVSVYHTEIKSHETFDDTDIRNDVYGYRLHVHVNPDNPDDAGFEIQDVFLWNNPLECKLVDKGFLGISGYYICDMFVTGRSVDEAIMNVKEYLSKPDVLNEKP